MNEAEIDRILEERGTTQRNAVRLAAKLIETVSTDRAAKELRRELALPVDEAQGYVLHACNMQQQARWMRSGMAVLKPLVSEGAYAELMAAIDRVERCEVG